MIKKSSQKTQARRSSIKVRMVLISAGSRRRWGRTPHAANQRGVRSAMASRPDAAVWSVLQTFVKVVNYQHMMPTRYTLDLDLKTAIPTDATETSEKRKTARQVQPASPAAHVLFKASRPRCSLCVRRQDFTAARSLCAGQDFIPGGGED